MADDSDNTPKLKVLKPLIEFKGAVLDLDGTLLDAEPLYFEAYQHAANSFGKEYTFDDAHKLIVGHPELEGAGILVRHLGLQEQGVTPQQFLEARDERFNELVKTVAPLPGAVELVRWLKETAQVPVAIATSSNAEYVAVKRAANEELFSLVDAVITGDDVRIGAGKPAPDIFLLGAEAISVAPEACVSVEDSVAGTAAAAAAGMWVASLAEPRIPETGYVDAGACALSAVGPAAVLAFLKEQHAGKA